MSQQVRDVEVAVTKIRVGDYLVEYDCEVETRRRGYEVIGVRTYRGSGRTEVTIARNYWDGTRDVYTREYERGATALIAGE